MKFTIKAKIFEPEYININWATGRKQTSGPCSAHLVGLFEKVHSSILVSIFVLKHFKVSFPSILIIRNTRFVLLLHLPFIIHIFYISRLIYKYNNKAEPNGNPDAVLTNLNLRAQSRFSCQLQQQETQIASQTTNQLDWEPSIIRPQRNHHHRLNLWGQQF